MRAWEILTESIPHDEDGFSMDILYHSELVSMVTEFESKLEQISDNFDIPIDQIYSSPQIQSGIYEIKFLIDTISKEHPNDRTLIKKCNHMLKYLKGDKLDW